MRYFVWEISIKKFEAFKYSLIIILVEVFGLYKNSKIALFIITCLNKKQAIARRKKGLEASEAVKVVLTNK